MKTLQMYTPNDLKNLARVSFPTILRLLSEKGYAPITTRPTRTGNRTANYYGPEAYEFAKSLGDTKAAKKAAKQARKDAWAAKRAAAAERRAMKGKKKETPADVIREQLPQAEQMALDLRTIPYPGPSLRELVTETNRLLQEMLDFWKK